MNAPACHSFFVLCIYRVLLFRVFRTLSTRGDKSAETTTLAQVSPPMMSCGLAKQLLINEPVELVVLRQVGCSLFLELCDEVIVH